MDFRSVEKNSIDVRLRPLPLGPFLEEMVQLYAHQLEREGRGLRLKQEAASPLHAEADPALLRRILWNLLENARLHGKGWVSLSARGVGAGVALEVEDEGEGLLP